MPQTFQPVLSFRVASCYGCPVFINDQVVNGKKGYQRRTDLQEEDFVKSFGESRCPEAGKVPEGPCDGEEEGCYGLSDFEKKAREGKVWSRAIDSETGASEAGERASPHHRWPSCGT